MMDEAGLVPQAGTAGGLRDHRAHRTAPWASRSMTVFPHDRLKITCTSADRQRPLHPVLQRRSHAGDVAAGAGARPHVLLLRGDRVPDQERPDQGRQPRERRRHPRRRRAHHRAAALPGGVRAAQDARHPGRPFAGRPPAPRTRGGHPAQPRGQLSSWAGTIAAQMRKPAGGRPSLRAAARRPKPPRPGAGPSRVGGGGWRHARHRAGDEDPAAPVSVPDGGPGHQDRGQQDHRASRTSPSTSPTSRGISPAIPSCRACCSSRPWPRWPAS